MKCYDCDGKGGWGHSSPETDYYGRSALREVKETFFRCPTCRGMCTVTEEVYRQSKKEADERNSEHERQLGEEAERFHRELDLERAINYINRYK